MKFYRRHLIGMGAAVASARAAAAQSPSRDAAEAGLTPLNSDSSPTSCRFADRLSR